MQIVVMALLIAPFIIVAVAANAETGDEFAELLGFRLGKEMNLVDVKKRLGQSRLIETGEAGEYEASVCYFVPRCGATVKFWSTELGGSDHGLIGFTLSRTEERPAQCSLLTLENCEVLHLAKGIRLGVRRGQFIEALGGKVDVRDDVIDGIFEWRRPMSDEEHRRLAIRLKDLPAGLYWDIDVYIKGRFQGDALQSIEISKTQTF